MKLSTGSLMLGASVTAVVAVVVAGLFVLGSPAEERARRIDARRVADLRGIVAATDLFWTRHSELPASLEALNREPGVRLNTGDPATSEIYGYQPLDSVQYELCASFERETEATSNAPAMAERNLWAHGSGQQCFQFEAEEILRTHKP
jgi:hypothetical protein